MYDGAYWPGAALLRAVQSWQRGLALPNSPGWLMNGWWFVPLCIVLGFVSLAWNSLRPANAEDQRTRAATRGLCPGL
jgi:hypothetical protein